MKVLYAYDKNSTSDEALNEAATTIKGTDGSLTVLYIQPRLGFANLARSVGGGSSNLNAEKAFSAVEGTEIRDRPAVRGTSVARRTLKEMGVKFDTITRRSNNPVKTIVNVASKGDYDLVYFAKGLPGLSQDSLEESFRGSKTKIKIG